MSGFRLSGIESLAVIPKELAAASPRPIVMSILSRGDDYGYSMIQRVREASGGERQWSEGMLYPVLHRLEDEGLISSIWKSTENGRRHKYHRLKAADRGSLATHRRQWLSAHKTLTQLWDPAPCSS
jgi:PadR family transcriptional regulator PadR